ncbi:MAG: GIY-YIG nuclease family protein [Hyphomicrobiaceae bacterium]|nr:GIY-YIG nuclease family protein [Hyphomicrobiaceae bacterium]
MISSKTYFVYITSNAPRGVLYVGMTSDLAKRAHEHHHRLMAGFTRRYWVDRVVYFEPHGDARVAANRERVLKRWRREWKIRLVERLNPTWRDLYNEILSAHGFDV